MFGSKLLRKNFEIVHGVIAFLLLFEQILIKLFAPHSESFTKYGAYLFEHFPFMCAYFRPGVGPENFGGGMQF